MIRPALLALADGTVFRGEAVGAAGAVTGEVVFNTAMTGYQEIATDPSYAGQIVTLTYPHIGNTGVNTIDRESASARLAGLVVRDVPPRASSWRAESGLGAWLQSQGVVAIAGIDTRKLTRRLREHGALGGCLMAGDVDEARALEAARSYSGMAGQDLAGEAGVTAQQSWRRGSWHLDLGTADAEPAPSGSGRFRVVAYDFGIKENILRLLVDRGCEVTVVPARTPASEVLAARPDGVFLSNGPGDPEPMAYAVAAVEELLSSGVPLFGICLGHQLLGLGAGARTVKMKFGHHGANHPVQELATGRVLITSQNHGFAVDEASLPSSVRATHRSLFDGSLQGIECVDKPAFGFQGHPEASPGPHDVLPLFDRFIEMMAKS